MARTVIAALAWAMAQLTGYNGLCLQFVRTAFGIPAKYPSAIAAWNGAAHKHKTTSTSGIPVGVPIFFSGGKYGHVAIYAGNGLMRTTNSSVGHPVTQSVAQWTRAGYYTLLGWTEDLNGVRVYTPPPPAPSKPSTGSSSPAVLKVGSKGAKVKALQQGLNKAFPAYSKLAVDSSFGPKVEAVVKEFQRRTGLAVDGVVGPKTTAKLATYGVTL
jgi:hypothetical protein